MSRAATSSPKRTRGAWALGLLAVTSFGSGCALGDPSAEGPVPRPSAVRRIDPNFPAEPVVCTQLAARLEVVGAGFAPLPVDVLTTNPRVLLPRVLLVSGSTEIDLAEVTYDQATKNLSAQVAAGTPPGTYDLVVENPTGQRGKLAGAVLVAAPPTVTGVAPGSASSATDTNITITGTGFRKAGDNTEPAGELSAAGLTTTPLAGEAWQSATTLTAIVPKDMTPGVYDLTITNPDGCTGALPAAYEVLPPIGIDLCSSVTPGFGWVNSRTTIEICANNANARGLGAVPEVSLLVDPDGDGAGIVEVPLIREAMMSTSLAAGGFDDASLMSAVVPAANEARGAGIAVGGPYTIKVVNPDGSVGYITEAFRVLPDPPPTVTGISPEQAETSQSLTMKVFGKNLKDPATSVSPRLARVLFLKADQAAGAACVGPNCYECASPAVTATSGADVEVSCAPPTGSMGSGSFVVRYEHLDDGSYSDFAAFAVTNPAGNLDSNTSVLSALNTPRLGHAAAQGRDDLGNRFVYVVGGQGDANASSALSSVEGSSLSRFGELGGWTILPNALPQALSGAAVVVQGRYVFVLGGRTAAGAPVNAVYRALILGSETAPVLAPPSTTAVGTLDAGTYSYRVAAVMSASGDNPDGETLASDAESVRLATAGAVSLSWTAIPGAAFYRVYRSPTANALAGSEELLADNVTGTTFVNDTAVGTTSAKKPLPPGSLGRWVSMPPLVTTRAEAAAVIAADPTGALFLYVLGGRDNAVNNNATASVEFAPLTETNGVWASGSFTTAFFSMSTGRAEHLAAVLDASTAPRIAGVTSRYVVVAQGIDNNTLRTDILRAKVQTGGDLGVWTSADASANADRYGMVGVLTNNYLFSLGGRKAGGGGYQAKGLTAVTCASGFACGTTDPPTLTWDSGDSGITLRAARYRAAMVYVGGYFYIVGGAESASVVLGSAERGQYNP